jgi:hypothetical protein
MMIVVSMTLWKRLTSSSFIQLLALTCKAELLSKTGGKLNNAASNVLHSKWTTRWVPRSSDVARDVRQRVAVDRCSPVSIFCLVVLIAVEGEWFVSGGTVLNSEARTEAIHRVTEEKLGVSVIINQQDFNLIPVCWLISLYEDQGIRLIQSHSFDD